MFVNDALFEISSYREFREIYDEYSGCVFKDICIKKENRETFLCLFNQTKAFIVYMRDDGDSGLSSRSGVKSDGFESFKLANGQMDEYPLENLIDHELSLDVIKDFIDNDVVSDKIEWHRD